MFVLRNENKSAVLLLAKVVDDFQLSGSEASKQWFHDSISKKFKVIRFISNANLIFNLLHISRSKDGDIVCSFEEYLSTIDKLEISKDRKRKQNESSTPEEPTAYQGLAVNINYLGHVFLPQARFVASSLQQQAGNLKVKVLLAANESLHLIRSLTPSLMFRKSSFLDLSVSYLPLSDAIQGKTSYGQTGYVSGINIIDGDIPIFHLIDWHSSKHSRVSFSSAGAGNIAPAESSDRASLTVACIKEIQFASVLFPLVLTVDSHGLYSTIITLHEEQDYCLRPTVSRLLDSFESKGINVMQ